MVVNFDMLVCFVIVNRIQAILVANYQDRLVEIEQLSFDVILEVHNQKKLIILK